VVQMNDLPTLGRKVSRKNSSEVNAGAANYR
jgi:hypothetical protein